MQKQYIALIFIFLLSGLGCTARNSNQGAPEMVDTNRPSGSVYYVQRPADGSPHRIVRTTLPDGRTDTVYTLPELAQLHEIEISADGNTLIFSQTPPPSTNNGVFDRTVLTRLDLTQPDAEPANFLGGEVSNEFYNMPILSPDGRYVYYSRLGPDWDGITGTDTFYGIERYDLETNERLPIVPNSIWPQLSPDGGKILFIILDVPTQQRGLAIVNADGTEPELLIDIGRYFDIDSPIFAPDGESVYLSIVETQPEATLFEKMLGLKVAYAHTEHNIPSAWWQLKLDGSEPVPLETEPIILNNGRFQGDGRFLFLSSQTGINYVSTEDLAKANVTPYEVLLENPDLGMLEWVAE